MKSRINGVKAIVALIGLSGFLAILLQIRPVPANQHSSRNVSASSTAAYPHPDSILSLSEEGVNPYPSSEEIGTEEQSTVCSKAGQWTSYQHKTAGLSFRYPSETQLQISAGSNGYDAISMDLKTECYPDHCWGLNGISISVLDNPKDLSLRGFVHQRFNPNASTAYAVSEKELDENIRSTIIDGEQGLLVGGKLTYERPQVYILHNDLIIMIGLTERSKGIWMDEAKPACKTAREIFDKLLASVQF